MRAACLITQCFLTRDIHACSPRVHVSDALISNIHVYVHVLRGRNASNRQPLWSLSRVHKKDVVDSLLHMQLSSFHALASNFSYSSTLPVRRCDPMSVFSSTKNSTNKCSSPMRHIQYKDREACKHVLSTANHEISMQREDLSKIILFFIFSQKKNISKNIFLFN